MSKLNPLHIERLTIGEDPTRINLSKGTGKTTAAALKLIARAIQSPNKRVAASDEIEYRDRLAVVDVALQLASRAGLRHIYPDQLDKVAIVFEYRKPTN